MKNGYAYIDDGGIMHVVEGIQTAIDYAKKGTKVMEFEGEFAMGYPVVAGEAVIVYGTDEMKHSGGGENIPAVPELAELYRKCSKEQ